MPTFDFPTSCHEDEDHTTLNLRFYISSMAYKEASQVLGTSPMQYYLGDPY